MGKIGRKDLGHACGPEGFQGCGTEGCHGFKRFHIDRFDGFIEHLGNNTDGEDGDGQEAGIGAHAIHQGKDVCDDEGWHGTGDGQDEAQDGDDDFVVADVAGSKDGQREGNQTAQHCSQQGHLDGIQQWFDDLWEIGKIGLEDLAHDDAEFMAALDENAEVEVGDLEGDDDDNQQDECDQWCP